MYEGVKCGDCGGKLGVRATRCRCGWVMPGAPRDVNAPPVKIIACCFSNCSDNAICRIFTSTGWANVCLAHYPQVARNEKSYSYNSPACVDARKVYEGSFHYRQKHGGRPAAPEDTQRTAELKQVAAELEEVRRRMEAAAGRQPGEDDDLALGIGRDQLEQEFIDGKRS